MLIIGISNSCSGNKVGSNRSCSEFESPGIPHQRSPIIPQTPSATAYD